MQVCALAFPGVGVARIGQQIMWLRHAQHAAPFPACLQCGAGHIEADPAPNACWAWLQVLITGHQDATLNKRSRPGAPVFL